MKNRLPIWFRQNMPSRKVLEFSELLKKRFRLNTICHSANCPNISHCFSQRHATFLILGNFCTRNCGFCAVENFNGQQDKLFVDKDESYRIADAVKFLNLDYVVITSVTRDDLSDGGAQHFRDTINIIKKNNTDIKIEILIPDFMGSFEALEKVIQSEPYIISHNLETVRRLYLLVRNKADYRRSLGVLRNVKLTNPNQITKSSLMLGLGETNSELKETLEDLRSVYCDEIVLGQYLRPSQKQYPVQKFYTPEEFNYWQEFAYNLDFKNVCAFPLARTSFIAKEQEICMM